MPRRRMTKPVGATIVTKYAEFQELVRKFVEGAFDLLVIVGPPGLSKSKSLELAIGKKPALVIKGRKSALDFYCDLYWSVGRPTILDDADNLLANSLCEEYVKALTESEAWVELQWGTATKLLDERDVPKSFHTNSTVCIITNWWDEKDPFFAALASRAEFIYFDPNWTEVYRQAASWFWDQEILDYVHERLDVLRQPDCRLLIKAYKRKKAGMIRLPWQAVIDEHVDDEAGLVVRKLLRDSSFTSNSDRAREFVERTGKDRATFYRRLKDIRRWQPEGRVARRKARRNCPPVSKPPAGVLGIGATVRQGRGG